MTRLRTIRRAAERAGEELVLLKPESLGNNQARRMLWHERLGSKDRKGCEELVNVQFDFKEETNHEY
jgi:hypothetical protein